MIIQEISIQFLGGSFMLGQLNHPTLSYTRRKAIKERIHTILPTTLTALRRDLEVLALVTHDTPIHRVFTRLVRIVEAQDVCQASFSISLYSTFL